MDQHAHGPASRETSDLVVSVVIPHYNDLANLAVCLAALERQTLPRDRFEVVVADNNSACDRADLERTCRGARLIDVPEQGAAAARNAGVAASSAPRLAFLDSDCIPAARWLEAGVAALEDTPLVGGRIEVGVRDPAALTSAEAFERIFAFDNERYIRAERFSVTANMFTTRAVFEHVGGFRNGISEDVDWGGRAADAGYRWSYAPDAVVEHPARHSNVALQRKWKRLTLELYGLERARGRGRARWIARNWALLLSSPLSIGRALASGRVPTFKDRCSAALVLVTLRWWRFVEAHRVAFKPQT